MTCCDSSKEEIQHRLEELKANGLENILALRGDRPENYSGGGSYTYAIDLIVISKFKGIFALVQPAIQKATWNVSIKKTTLVS